MASDDPYISAGSPSSNSPTEPHSRTARAQYPPASRDGYTPRWACQQNSADPLEADPQERITAPHPRKQRAWRSGTRSHDPPLLIEPRLSQRTAPNLYSLHSLGGISTAQTSTVAGRPFPRASSRFADCSGRWTSPDRQSLLLRGSVTRLSPAQWRPDSG
jgi:hypothetical protein